MARVMTRLVVRPTRRLVHLTAAPRSSRRPRPTLVGSPSSRQGRRQPVDPADAELAELVLNLSEGADGVGAEGFSEGFAAVASRLEQEGQAAGGILGGPEGGEETLQELRWRLGPPPLGAGVGGRVRHGDVGRHNGSSRIRLLLRIGDADRGEGLSQG